MRRGAPFVLAGLLIASAGVARAASPVTVRVDAARRVAQIDAGSTHHEAAIELPQGAALDGAQVKVDAVAIGGGKSVQHVRAPLRGENAGAWEALVAPDGAVIWSGLTGVRHGQEGEYAGTALEIDPPYVLVGDVREDLGVCGEARTLLDPKAVDPKTMTLRGVTMQRLSAERRDEAERVIATRHEGAEAPPLARLLVATGASTAIGAPSALTDGDPQTTWSEARPSDGHGEFVSMRAPGDVPIARFSVMVAPSAPSPHGAAPKSFYLATNDRVIEVTMPEDAWLHPGAAYDVPLAEPLRASCLSLVLDKAYGDATRDVTLAEVVAYSEFDGAGARLETAAAALAGGGARAEAAKGVLERAGDAGLAAAAAAFPTLDAPGRALAIDAAIAAGTCEAGTPLLVAAMGDAEREVARKAREKIERCGKRAAPGLVAAVKDGDVAMRASAAPMLASIAPREAIAPLAAALATGPRATRDAVRGALAKAARAATKDELAALVGDAARGPDARLDLIRALDESLPQVEPQADAAIASLAAEGAPMRTRYLLAEPLASLARAGDTTARARLALFISRDPDAAVRAHAAASARGLGDLAAPGLADDAPRVREAALQAVTGADVRDVDRARALLDDEWTFVRAAAASFFARRADGESALAKALGDRAPTVRRIAADALAARPSLGEGARTALLARMNDDREDRDTRKVAIDALAAACEKRAIDPLRALTRDDWLGPVAQNALRTLATPGRCR